MPLRPPLPTRRRAAATYDSSKDGPPGYADVDKAGQAYVKAAPERMVWGSNWPHPNETNKPDDALRPTRAVGP
jgi:predicted TIM-barrel fold metal-dependent hydrolase